MDSLGFLKDSRYSHIPIAPPGCLSVCLSIICLSTLAWHHPKTPLGSSNFIHHITCCTLAPCCDFKVFCCQPPAAHTAATLTSSDVGEGRAAFFMGRALLVFLWSLNPDVFWAVVQRAGKKNLECSQGINQSLEQQALHGTMCSGLCLCKFICQTKVLDAERLCLLSELTPMKNEKRQGSSQGSVL